MRRLAEIAESKGHTVTGSDAAFGGHDSKNVEKAELVVYSAAVEQNNCELVRARQKGIPSLERAEFLASLCAEYANTIALSGSHGKTTATAITAEIFKGKYPTVHIGGDYPGCSERPCGTEFFITEACEYKKSFLRLHPMLSVVLNTELDHTDFFKSEAEYFSAFVQFCAQSKTAAVFGDDPALFKLAKQNGYTTFGFLSRNDYSAQKIIRTESGRVFNIYERGKFLTQAELNLVGEHNVLNALAGAVAARSFGLSEKEIADGIKRFSKVARRFEFLGEVNGARVYSDYAHHPTEIVAMILSARETGAKKVTVVFEPHTYSRTQSLYRPFAKSLSSADEIFLMPIYASRERSQEGIGSWLILNEMRRIKKQAVYFEGYDALFSKLHKTVGESQTIVFAGAGTIDEYARRFVFEFGKNAQE